LGRKVVFQETPKPILLKRKAAARLLLLFVAVAVAVAVALLQPGLKPRLSLA
jgi:hypothetical protein